MILEALNIGAHLVIVIATIFHMNAMTRQTPKLEVATWWMIGVGSASEAWLGPAARWFIDPMFTVGAMMLAVLCAQPEWRPALADRRKNPEPQVPPDGDRRCQTLLGLRNQRSGDYHG